MHYYYQYYSREYFLDNLHTASDGSLFRFHLEGMLHIERPGLVIAGLAGPLANDASHYVLRLMTRIERVV